MAYNRRAYDNPGFDPFREFVASVPELVRKSRLANEDETYSYRGFKVGVTGLFWVPDTQDTVFLSAGNLKKQGKPKFCAEQRLLIRARKAGFTQAIGLVITATTDRQKISEVTGLPTPTLHPCEECRSVLSQDKMMTADTLLLTTGVESSYFQVHRFGELVTRYSEGEIEALQHTNISSGFSDWEHRLEVYDGLVRGITNPDISRSYLAQTAMLSPVA